MVEVTRLVREHAGGWLVLTGLVPSSSRETEPPQPPVRAVNTVPGPVLWLCGPTGVGKSTVG